MIFKVSQNDAEYFDNWKFKWKILPNKEKIENTFCKQEDKVLTLQVSIYLMITMNTNPQLIYTYFINTNSVIIIVIAEKRKHISTCDPHFIDDSPTLHTQCTPLSNIARLRISAINIILIGSLLPMVNNPPKFAQLYIYDTDNEVKNRLAQNP